jgi:hypothetical protein
MRMKDLCDEYARDPPGPARAGLAASAARQRARDEWTDDIKTIKGNRVRAAHRSCKYVDALVNAGPPRSWL